MPPRRQLRRPAARQGHASASHPLMDFRSMQTRSAPLPVCQTKLRDLAMSFREREERHRRGMHVAASIIRFRLMSSRSTQAKYPCVSPQIDVSYQPT
jgi:hypothetical protein